VQGQIVFLTYDQDFSFPIKHTIDSGKMAGYDVKI